MKDNTLLFGILKDVLGRPKRRNNTKQQYAFDCPVCSAEKGEYDGDGKGNLEVNLNEGIYHCWACGEINDTKGTLNKLFKNFATKQQIKKLKLIGYDIDYFKSKRKTKEKNIIEDLILPDSFIEFKDSNPKSLLHKQAWNYLVKQRKLTEEIIHKHKIGYTKSGKYSSRIILPSYDVNDELNYWVGRTYVNEKPKYLNPDSDKEEIIFNECCLNWDSDIYLVEGPFDHIVIHNSIPLLGKKISDKLMNLIYHKTTANVIILMDSDAWKDAKNLYSKLNVGKLFGRIKIIKLEEGYDIAKVHEDFGRKGVINVMKSAYKLKESEL